MREWAQWNASPLLPINQAEKMPSFGALDFFDSIRELYMYCTAMAMGSRAVFSGVR